jgi:hypothetical protein
MGIKMARPSKYKPEYCAVRYRIITAIALGPLEERVNIYMEDGWRPVGGITVDNSIDSSATYLQAIELKR